MDLTTYRAIQLCGFFLGLIPWIVLYLCTWKRSIIAHPWFDRVFGSHSSPPGLGGKLKYIVLCGLMSLFMNTVLFLALLPPKVGIEYFPRFCIIPREGWGLLQIVNASWYHFGFMHYAMNNFGLWTLGPLVLSYNRRTFVSSLFFISYVGGFFVWLVSPSKTCSAGFSTVIFGWYGMLTLSLLLECPPKWWRIVMMLIVGTFLSASMYSEVFGGDDDEGVSWHSHVCGFGTGLVYAYLRFRRKWFLYEGFEDRVRPAGAAWPGLCEFLRRMLSEAVLATKGAVTDIVAIFRCRGPAPSQITSEFQGNESNPTTFGKFSDKA